MLPNDLRQDVLELAAISKECSENLQQRCFELLLSHYLDGLKRGSDGKGKLGKEGKADKEGNLAENGKQNSESEVLGDPPEAKSQPSDTDLAMKNLHVKAKKFLEKSGTTLEDLNQIFFREGDALKPLYEDLKLRRLPLVKFALPCYSRSLRESRPGNSSSMARKSARSA